MSKLSSLFNKYRSLVACGLIVFIHTGINSVATAAMPYLRQYYGCDLSTIIAGASACSFAMFIAGFIGAKFIRAVKPKGAFYISSLCAGIYALLIVSTNQVWGFYIGCASIGLTAAWGGYATSNIFIHRFYENHAPTFIAAMSALGMLGGAGFQFMAGFLLKNLGLRGLYFVMICCAGVAIVINFFLTDNISAEEKDISRFTKKHGDFSIYKNHTFIRMLIITLFGGSSIAVFGTLCMTFLMEHGITTEISATCLSCYTMCAGIMALVSGVLADKKGYRFYVKFLYTMYVIAIIMALIFDRNGSIIIMIFMLIAFAASSPIGSVYIMLSKPIFKENSLLAHTQLLSVGSLGSALILPLLTKLYENMGFSFLWCLVLTIEIICFMLLIPIVPNKEYSPKLIKEKK